MQTLTSLCASTGIKSAIIVDDGYDLEPRARDFPMDSSEWDIFFDDVKTEDREKLTEIFPEFSKMKGQELRASDEFVKILWNKRSDIRSDLIGPLFERYSVDKAGDSEYLKNIEAFLSGIGVRYVTAGRNFEAKAQEADLIIIDLYLDSIEQSKDTLAISRDGLRNIVSRRRSNPPLVVLMSRNPNLAREHADFRDKAQLPESVFRIIAKDKLREQSAFLRLVTRLVRHYPDSLKLAAFVNAWHEGLGGARDRTCELMRKLDLTDCAQINRLLLDSEKEPLGNYLVDIFDRVLQHEIERDDSIILAAKGLNELTTKNYPPPHIEDAPAFQTLIFEALYQNSKRLALATPDNQIAFGDILKMKAGVTVPHALLPEIKTTNVLLALTPACDVQRQGVNRVIFIRGTLEPLNTFQAASLSPPPRTPIILIGNQRMWISWDLKHIETLSFAQIGSLISPGSDFEVIGRLRESHALELQQKLLASLGRVGQPAPMPNTFLVNLSVYVLLATGRLSRLDTPSLDRIPCIHYSGRIETVVRGETKAQKESRILICEKTCEEICSAMAQVDLTTIHSSCSAVLNTLRSGVDFLNYLEVGLPYPNNKDFMEMKSVLSGADTDKVVGLMRIGELTELTPGQYRNGGVVIFVRPIEEL
jgi:hypothetical protein